MFSTAEDFNTPPYKLLNLDDADNATEFEAFVDREEQKRLKKILGSSLYNAFVAGLFTGSDPLTPIAEEAIEQRWKDLRDGVDYDYNDKTFHWEGMIEMLKPYIYSKWIKVNYRKLSGAGGIIIPMAENGSIVAPSDEIVESFNDFSSKCGNQCKQEDTLYGYLYNSEETFADDFDDDYSSIQEYLIAVFQDPGTMNFLNL